MTNPFRPISRQPGNPFAPEPADFSDVEDGSSSTAPEPLSRLGRVGARVRDAAYMTPFAPLAAAGDVVARTAEPLVEAGRESGRIAGSAGGLLRDIARGDVVGTEGTLAQGRQGLASLAEMTREGIPRTLRAARALAPGNRLAAALAALGAYPESPEAAASANAERAASMEQPATPIGRGTAVASRVGSELATYLAPGAIASAPAKLGRGAAFALDLATQAPLDAAAAAAGRESSLAGFLAGEEDDGSLLDRIARSPASRVAFDVGLGGLASAAVHGVGAARAVGKARAAETARGVETARDVERFTEAEGIAGEARQAERAKLLQEMETRLGHDQTALDRQADVAQRIEADQATSARAAEVSEYLKQNPFRVVDVPPVERGTPIVTPPPRKPAGLLPPGRVADEIPAAAAPVVEPPSPTPARPARPGELASASIDERPVTIRPVASRAKGGFTWQGGDPRFATTDDQALLDEFMDVTERSAQRMRRIDTFQRGGIPHMTKGEAYREIKLAKLHQRANEMRLYDLRQELEGRGWSPESVTQRQHGIDEAELERVALATEDVDLSDVSFVLDEAGRASPRATSGLGGAAVGAAAGAAVDDENPFRGAIAGGLAGAGLAVGAEAALRRGARGRVTRSTPPVDPARAGIGGHQTPLSRSPRGYPVVDGVEVQPPREHVQVPTARFAGEPKERFRQRLKVWARKHVRGNFTNRQTGWDIRVTGHGLDHGIMGHRLHQDDHFEAVAELPALLESAEKVVSRAPDKPTPELVAIHRLAAGLNVEGREYVVLMTVKEDGMGRRYYDHRLTQMIEAPAGSSTSFPSREGPGSSPSAGASPIKLPDGTPPVKPSAPDEPAGGAMLFSTPVTAALKALGNRAGQSASLAGLGAALAQSDDADIAQTGRATIGLAALHALGWRRMVGAGGKVGTKLVDALRTSQGGKSVVRFFNPETLLSPEVKRAILGYEQTVAKGRARAGRARVSAERLGPTGDRAASELIDSDDFGALEQVAPEEMEAVVGVAQAIADEFDALGALKVESGVLPEVAVAKHRGTYGGPRLYAEYEALDALGERVGQGQKKPRIGPQKRRTLGSSPEDLAYRDELGEIREASYRAARGLEKGYRDVAAAKLFQSLRTMPGVVHPAYAESLDDFLAARELVKTAEASGESADEMAAVMQQAKAELDAIGRRFDSGHGDYVRMPDTPGMGILRGMVVQRDVANSLNGLPDLRATSGFLTFWKKKNTVWNPGTHVGNSASNVVMSHMAGMPMWEQPARLRQAFRDMVGYGEGTRELAEAGVLDLNVVTAGSEGAAAGRRASRDELLKLLKTSRPETIARLAERGVEPTTWDEMKALLKRADGPLAKLYNNEDNIFRVALYLHERAAGKSAAEAVALSRDNLINFRSRSPALRLLRGTVAPFILYPAKALPTFARHVVEHPWRYMALVASWGMVNELAESQVGAIDQTDVSPQQRRGATGYTLPGLTQVPFAAKDREGRRPAYDITRWTPLSGITTNAPPGAAVSQLSDRIPGILNPSGPWTDLASIPLNVDPYTGKPRLTPGMTEGEMGGALADALGDLALPPILGFQRRRLAQNIAEGDERALGQNALGLLGLRPRFVRPGEYADQAKFEFEQSLREAKQNLRRGMRRSQRAERDRDLLGQYERRVDRATARYEKRVAP